MLLRLSPLRFALVFSLLDAVWAVQALSAAQVHAVSNVELISLILWCFFHLPALLLANLLLHPWMPADPQATPASALAAAGLLALAQTWGLAYFGWRWWQARRVMGAP
jgi:hypothetical protein